KFQEAFLVGTAMKEGVGHRLQLARGHCPFPRQVHHPGYTAHGLFSKSTPGKVRPKYRRGRWGFPPAPPCAAAQSPSLLRAFNLTQSNRVRERKKSCRIGSRDPGRLPHRSRAEWGSSRYLPSSPDTPRQPISIVSNSPCATRRSITVSSSAS